MVPGDIIGLLGASRAKFVVDPPADSVEVLFPFTGGEIRNGV